MRYLSVFICAFTFLGCAPKLAKAPEIVELKNKIKKLKEDVDRLENSFGNNIARLEMDNLRHKDNMKYLNRFMQVNRMVIINMPKAIYNSLRKNFYNLHQRIKKLEDQFIKYHHQNKKKAQKKEKKKKQMKKKVEKT